MKLTKTTLALLMAFVALVNGYNPVDTVELNTYDKFVNVIGP